MSRAATSARDPRIDFLRGFALITIFIDHVPANPLNQITMRNFGFADATELFVVLAGISSMMAYGRCFERTGARSGLWRVALRCLRIYLVQIALLLTALVIVRQWLAHFGLEPVHFAAFFDCPAVTIGQALAMLALPASLNILPLYVVLLAFFPLIYAGIRYLPWPTIVVSATVWLIANVDHDFNLTNRLDGQGWFFNPFAWQFLFTIGVLAATVLRANGGDLPRIRLLTVACSAYLGMALALAAPWVAWGLSEFRVFDFDPPDKTNLSPMRLLDIVALVYLALSSPSLRSLAAQRCYPRPGLRKAFAGSVFVSHADRARLSSDVPYLRDELAAGRSRQRGWYRCDSGIRVAARASRRRQARAGRRGRSPRPRSGTSRRSHGKTGAQRWPIAMVRNRCAPAWANRSGGTKTHGC
jgi:hypothetical protein